MAADAARRAKPGLNAGYPTANRPRTIACVLIPDGGGAVHCDHDWSDSRKNHMLFSAGPHPDLAEGSRRELDVNVTTQTARDFANGEIFVRFDESVRGCDAFVLQSHPARSTSG